MYNGSAEYARLIANSAEEEGGDVALALADTLGQLDASELLDELTALQNTLWRALDAAPHAPAILAAQRPTSIDPYIYAYLFIYFYVCPSGFFYLHACISMLTSEERLYFFFF